MMKAILSHIMAKFRVFALVGLILATSCATKWVESEKVSWEQAVALIREGSIESVMQTHSLDVWMRSKDGRQYQTCEPRIDAVWDLIDEVDPGHQRIRFGTE